MHEKVKKTFYNFIFTFPFILLNL